MTFCILVPVLIVVISCVWIQGWISGPEPRCSASPTSAHSGEMAAALRSYAATKLPNIDSEKHRGFDVSISETDVSVTPQDGGQPVFMWVRGDCSPKIHRKDLVAMKTSPFSLELHYERGHINVALDKDGCLPPLRSTSSGV